MFPLFQWLMYLMVLVWFLGVAIYLSSMKLYVFKVKGLNNDADCVCSDNFYKVRNILRNRVTRCFRNVRERA